MRQRQRFSEYKERAIVLRRQGNSYADIRNIVGVPLPQSTLSEWLSGLELTEEERDKLAMRVEKKLKMAQAKSIEVRKALREGYLENIRHKIKYVPAALKNPKIAKIALAMLYWCEGGKASGGIIFGNSDPTMIKTFLSFMRQCYQLDETKFRGTVQCRADQDPESLQAYWTEITGIPSNKFLRAKIDPRTIGKPTLKTWYKGVLRIDYFSSDIYNELKEIWHSASKGR